MSKSYNNTLALSASEDSLYGEIKKMKTDVNRVRKTDKGNPANCPVFTYYDFFATDRKEEIENSCKTASIGCIDCKKIVADQVVQTLAPFREKKIEVENNPKIVKDILFKGTDNARRVAATNIEKIKTNMGFLNQL